MSHAVVHFEVTGRDVQKLQGFYSELFGWKTQSVPGMEYVLVDKEGDGIAGGLGQTQNGGEGFVTFYVQAEDPQAVLDDAVRLGGKVLMEVSEMPQVTLAMFADPEGHVIGVVKGP
jgi:uncharacterized protein